MSELAASQDCGIEKDPLEQLLDTESVDRSLTPDASAVARPGREWASVRVQVRIQGKPN